MARTFAQRPVKLVTSIIYGERDDLEKAERLLKRSFGPVEPLEKDLAFDYTDYYYDEMGRPLRRKLLCFKRLINKDGAGRIKLRTNGIEDRFSSGGKRKVNIDPGYVTEAKLVLLTTKDYTHRVYVGGRVFAESTLFFRDGMFRPWQWTYPDYASDELISYFNEVREIYMEDIKDRRVAVRPCPCRRRT